MNLSHLILSKQVKSSQVNIILLRQQDIFQSVSLKSHKNSNNNKKMICKILLKVCTSYVTRERSLTTNKIT